jgi:sigma-B regulation protein RsbU (phosphoserine phosphatase)
MGKTQVNSSIAVLTESTDVVYLSDKLEMPPEIKRLFRRERLSFRLLPLIGYTAVRNRPDLVGAVVIDAVDVDVPENPDLGRIIESLERDNVGTILLTKRVRRPVRSFSLTPSESSFSMTRTVESVSIDDLWAQIRVNLTRHKRHNHGITVKPPTLSDASERLWKNRMERQLPQTGTLVDSLTEQLRLAGLVQQDFLPSHLPNCEEVQWAATLLPAEWVSGDIYDVTRIDEQHIGFYVADAVGHSMPAALLTIFIKQALVMRETTGRNYRIFSPTEVMTNLNLRMASQRLSGYQFATCCYGLLNTKTRQLTFARAGHPYPILLRPGEPPQQLQTRGALLGIFENADFIQQTIPLEAGDRVLLYTDGIEWLVGCLEDGAGFRFAEPLLEVKDAPITDIVDRLTELANARDVDPSELDDQTLVGLEIR